ncbi:MAG: hypothetical protein KFF73_03300 [Cyclobacteriaceae bacterium]|nr:hypothetical protein [Cyclobacteriaceae bacterium]
MGFYISHIIVPGFITMFLSCSSPVSLNMDKARWISDQEGCTGYRMEVYQNIMNEKDKLLGLSNKKIVQLLGNPNINELYIRNQKFFVYQVSSGKSCGGQAKEPDLFLIFRFTAMGLVNEIYMNDKASPTD